MQQMMNDQYQMQLRQLNNANSNGTNLRGIVGGGMGAANAGFMNRLH